jgi:hypothetical protein
MMCLCVRVGGGGVPYHTIKEIIENNLVFSFVELCPILFMNSTLFRQFLSVSLSTCEIGPPPLRDKVVLIMYIFINSVFCSQC